MPTPFENWTVLPHAPIEAFDDNILSVEGLLAKFPRRMTVVRISGQRLIIHSGIALSETEMSRIENFGKPSFYIVPSELHRMEVKNWKQRYPELQVICPAGARARVEELVKVDTVTPDFGDPAAQYTMVEGTAQREGVLTVHGSQGATLVLNDLIFNVRRQPGLMGLVFSALGLTGPQPKMPWLMMRRLAQDKSALRAQLERWAHLLDLKRMIVSHGKPLDAQPRAVLRKLAAAL